MSLIHPRHLRDPWRLFAADIRKVAAEENNGNPQRYREASNELGSGRCVFFRTDFSCSSEQSRIDHRDGGDHHENDLPCETRILGVLIGNSYEEEHAADEVDD